MRGCWSFSWSGKCAIHAPLKGTLDKHCTNVTGLERIQISFARQIPSQSVFSAQRCRLRYGAQLRPFWFWNGRGM
jgi:hypothetical protein